MIYPHGDLSVVENMLHEHRSKHARAWIVTDGVFGMDGDVAPLTGLCDLADRFNANVIVDEAHATGVLGADGSGTCEELGVKSRVAIRIGTLSKALGSHGGFVVGPQVVIDYLVNRCRTLIFSTAGSPMTVAAAVHAVKVIIEQPTLRQRVRHLASTFREHLSDLYPNQVPPTKVKGIPIVPLIIGANERAVQLSACLAADGFFVPAIRPPTVPEGTARLRFSFSASHRDDEVTTLFASIEKHMRE